MFDTRTPFDEQVRYLYGTLTMRLQLVERASDVQSSLPSWARRAIETNRSRDPLDGLANLAPITAVDSPPHVIEAVRLSAEACLTICRVIAVRLPNSAGIEAREAVDDLAVLFATEWETYSVALRTCTAPPSARPEEFDWISFVELLRLRAALHLHPSVIAVLGGRYRSGLRLLQRLQRPESQESVGGLVDTPEMVRKATEDAVIILTEIPDHPPGCWAT